VGFFETSAKGPKPVTINIGFILLYYNLIQRSGNLAEGEEIFIQVLINIEGSKGRTF
jgi:hypothetical protein